MSGRTLSGVASAAGFVAESFHLLHFIPVDGERLGSGVNQTESPTTNLGQRFSGGVDQRAFRLSLSNDKNLSGGGECVQHRLGNKTRNQ